MKHATCVICKKLFVPKSCSRGLYCSYPCLWKHRKQLYSGRSNPNWKGGRISDGHGYVLVYRGKNRHEYEHRIVVEESLGRKLRPEEYVHHINGNKSDNRPENLEVIDPASHSLLHCLSADASKHRSKTSQFKGVYLRSDHKKWVARITSNGSDRYLGSFSSEIEAAKAYNAAAIDLWGEKCYLNPI